MSLRIRPVHDKLEEVHNSLTDITTNQTALQLHIADLRGRAQYQENNSHQLESRLETNIENIEYLRSDIDNLGEDMESLEREMSTLRDEMNEFQVKYEYSIAKMTEIHDDMERFAAYLVALQLQYESEPKRKVRKLKVHPIHDRE